MKRYALLGKKLSHSYSKLVHEYIFQKFSWDASYSFWELEEKDIEKAIPLAKEKKLDGFNITVPYKECLLSQIDSIDEAARRIGAINTIVKENNKMIGYNTDCSGFQKMLEYFAIDVDTKKIVILGTGGASKAVAEALRLLGAASIQFVSRSPVRTQLSYGEYLEGDILINTTPVGMYPDKSGSPISKEVFSHFSTAIDLIYNPKETQFLSDAKSFGLFSINGLFMLVAQAIRSEEIWFHKRFDISLYHEVYSYLEGIIYENYGNSRS
ncbi:shikimate dehydrogenase [Fusobacterium necrophorum]|uniref:shikimate dehydrogenase family protein n=1 Tax=Fusobacterium necrophorum TaxID=859 RepID=UPI00254CC814|nr:shikimate dehydrogenase [Fusobacterium necrophorum]MDK4521847.1 shikimate dehydrogenase [Fusobacterium necrophorum]